MMQIGNTVGQERRTGFRAFAGNLRLFMPENLARTLAVPAMMLLLVAGAGASSAALVAAAHDTLPGNMLYGVKLAAEAVSLRLASKSDRTERRVEIAGRRLDEIARLSTSSGSDKEAKIAKAASLFSDEMIGIRQDLAELQTEGNADVAVKVAMQVDAKTDAYQDLFKNGLLVGRPALRLALLNLDQVSVKALEILVEKQSLAANVLPEAELTSSVGKRIDTFAAHVAVAQDSLGAKTTSQSLLLTTKAKQAVEEAKQLLSQGDFRAAVLKVNESADLVTQAETADKNSGTDGSATATAETNGSATATSP